MHCPKRDLVSELTPQFRLRDVHRWPIPRRLRQALLSNPGRYLSLIDQGMVALCRFAAIIIFARLLSPHQFGAIALAMSVAILFVGFVRATFTLPFAAFCADRRQVADDGAKWFAFSLFLVMAALVLPLAVALLLNVLESPAWLIHTAVYSAALSPTTALYEVSRRWLFQLERYRSLLLQGVICGIVSAISFGVVFAFPSPWTATLALSLAYLVAALMGLAGNIPVVRLQIGEVTRVWREIRHFTRWTTVEFIADSLQSYGMNVALAFFAGPTGASIFAATRNIVAPVYTMTSALGAEMPRLARAYASSGLRGLTRALWSTQVFMLAVSIPYLLVIAFFSEPLLRFLYGAKYSNLSTELRLWAVIALLLVIMRPLDMWLLASRNARTLFMRKLLGALATIAVAVPLLPIAGVQGALYAIIAGMAANVLGLVATVYRPRGEAEAAKPAGLERILKPVVPGSSDAAS
jgi:PST family polysaccharide transporter